MNRLIKAAEGVGDSLMKAADAMEEKYFIWTTVWTLPSLGEAIRDGEREVGEVTMTVDGQILGTPSYMSPEQVTAKRIGIDHRTDVFSLGVSLWEALALQRPFEGDTSQQVLHKIMVEDPADPRTLRSRCPRDLAVICMKAMEKDPNQRFQTAEDFAADLRRHGPCPGGNLPNGARNLAGRPSRHFLPLAFPKVADSLHVTFRVGCLVGRHHVSLRNPGQQNP